MSDTEIFPVGSIVVYRGSLRAMHGTYVVVADVVRHGVPTRTLRPCAVCIGPAGTPSPYLTGGEILSHVNLTSMRSALPA